MDALDIIRKRRSVRFFRKDENVPDKDVELILDAGRWAPSARNLQPIEYVVVRDLDIRKKLAEISRQSQPKDAPVSIIVLGDVERARLVGKVSPHDVTTSKTMSLAHSPSILTSSRVARKTSRLNPACPCKSEASCEDEFPALCESSHPPCTPAAFQKRLS